MSYWAKKQILILVVILMNGMPFLTTGASAEYSVAREWNEQTLEAIRRDFARPTVHARNLYHVSAAMWDAWAAYQSGPRGVLYNHPETANDIEAARNEAISYAAYRLLTWRFAYSPGAAETISRLKNKMQELGYEPDFMGTEGPEPAAVGNRIAAIYIQFGLHDGANEQNDYVNRFYEPVNEPLVPDLPGNPDLSHPNRWQPLALDFFIDQSGNVVLGGFPEFLSPEWGTVWPFSLRTRDLTIYQRDGSDYFVYHDPGPPPYLGAQTEEFQSTFETVILWSGLLDPADGEMIDISPAARGNNQLGTNNGNGYEINPVTGAPYENQFVPAGDYYRVLAEFWADGPDSETPPGHWFTIANYVSDHPLTQKRFEGQGSALSDLEWDVKLYLTLGGAMHDVAIAAWGTKGWYDYIRPVSALRYMCDQGQSSDPKLPNYHPEGISLYPGAIELITPDTGSAGGKHFHLAGADGENIGKIAVYAWQGPEYIDDPDTDVAGVGWIRCENWWPYQRPTFVTPPFAGYVSGHSTYSRAAAYILSTFTGDEYFPGGMGTFEAPQNEFLVFEEGPSVNITLQWAKYYDAADECSLSRIYGGIHPPADDIPGRLMGAAIGIDAFRQAKLYYGNQTPVEPLKPTPIEW